MKISVIVPIYNMEKFIARAISCLKAQDEPNVEFILVNDGSTDATLSILEQLCTRDGRFHIFSMENRGYGHACNFGIEQATGDFWAIYEPDDCIAPDFYSTLRKTAERYRQADVIRYNGIYRHENGQSRTLYHWKQNFTGRILDKYALKRFWRSHPSVFNGIYRKNFMLQKSVCFCETPGASFQDAMFIVSLFYANPSIYIINDVKYTYTIHDMQSIQFVNDKIDFVIEAWEREADWISSNGFSNYDFFIYISFMQLDNILNKVSSMSRSKLEHNFMRISKQKIYINNNIPTLKEKIKYTYFCTKNFFNGQYK